MMIKIYIYAHLIESIQECLKYNWLRNNTRKLSKNNLI